MAPEYRNDNWIQNYFFVDFPVTDSHYAYRDKRRDAAHQLSGMLKVRLVTVDPLFIGSGFQELEGGEFVKQTLTEHGRPIIPGSSLKGAVRHICRAVSKSCVPCKTDKKGKPIDIVIPKDTNVQCTPKADNACIVCDMFGKMGWGSKVFFSDLIAECETTARFHAAQQFAPHPEAEKYLDEDGYHAYKFYKTKIDDVTRPKKDILCAVVPKTVFTGEISYRNLDEKELGLLLFGLGQSGTLSLKLGGYRNEGFGTVNISLASEQISDVSALVKKYTASVDDELNNRISQLEGGMPYKA